MTENRDNGQPENGKVPSAEAPEQERTGEPQAETAGAAGATGATGATEATGATGATEGAAGGNGGSRGTEGAGQTPRDPLGSVAEEAMKLFDALQQRVMREVGKNVVKSGARAGMSGLGQAFGTGRSAPRDVWSEAVAEHDPHGDEEYICRACPICRMKAASRESGGEVTDHLVAAGGELFAAVRQAFEALQRPASGSRSRDREREPRPSRVEHIDLG